MRNKRPGCLTPFGLAAALITLLAIAISVAAQGGTLFSPGPLNAQAGARLGGVRSHAEIGGNCAACHTAPWDITGMMERCLDCHTQIQADHADPGTLHGALYQRSGDAGCLSCHTEHHGLLAELTRVEIDDFPHDATGFSLASHQRQPEGIRFTCEDCHVQQLNGRRFEPVSDQDCAICHDRLDPAYMEEHRQAFTGACQNCHDGVDHFTGFDHNLRIFTLENAHALVACQACHQSQNTPVALKQTPRECAACHVEDEPHQGEFGSECVLCHTTTIWQEILFDHGASRFPLKGMHEGLPCESCHVQSYRGTPLDCAACHEENDPHSGGFGSDCQLCHTTHGWSEIIFDHATSRFPLDGAHAILECQSCHQQDFRGTPLDCTACHEEPDYHAGVFQNACADCHSTSAWLPADYPLAHSFPRNHEGADSCRDCHTSTLEVYTCFTCHDQREMISEHRDEGITDLTDCASCHPDGTEDGGRDDDD